MCYPRNLPEANRHDLGAWNMPKFSDKWLSRAANLFTFSPLVPSGVLGVIGGALSTGVGWINQAGWWGWFTTGLTTFLIVFAVWSGSLLMFRRARFLRIETEARERTLGEGSPFDPMARVFENKRLYLRDLAPLGRKQVIAKKFINCEIIGPGTAILGLRSNEQHPFPKMTDCQTYDVDCVEIDAGKVSQLAIAFTDCDFEGCKFYHMTLLFISRENENLGWITKDSRQTLLPAPILMDAEQNEPKA
jgi:hypothetical protein